MTMTEATGSGAARRANEAAAPYSVPQPPAVVDAGIWPSIAAVPSGLKVAVGMYMIVMQNSVKFFADTVFNIDPDAETLADITVQMADVGTTRMDGLLSKLRAQVESA